MATGKYVVVGVLLLQMYVNGKENATIETGESKILSPTLTGLVDKNNTNTQGQISKNVENSSTKNQNDQGDQGQRQKRGYNFNGYPPFSPIYPNYPSRFDPPINIPFDQEDPLVQIHRRLSDIAAIVRQPTLPPIPPATRYPIFLPFFLPSNNCGCTACEHIKPPHPDPTQPFPIPSRPTPPTPQETKPPLPSKNITVPSRGPEITDDVNPSFIEQGEDFSRPISFDPIPPNDDIKRKPPPVEHGSVQGDNTSVNSVGSTPFTAVNSFGSTTIPPPVNIDSSRYIPSLPNPDTPTVCDKAIISCCHQVTITYNCFATQGCPDPTSYGSPCDTVTILRVIERLQKFYGPRVG